jgi:hypothetical protein
LGFWIKVTIYSGLAAIGATAASHWLLRQHRLVTYVYSNSFFGDIEMTVASNASSTRSIGERIARITRIVPRVLVVAGLAIGFASPANGSLTLAIGDAYYLGKVTPGSPASDSDQVARINVLNTRPASSSDFTTGGYTYNRVGSSIAGPFPLAVETGSFRQDDNTTTITLTGIFKYILAKYANKNRVWYVASGVTGEVTVPANVEGGLSHTSFYNYSPVVMIPEPATILVWSGLIALAVSAVSRFRNRE